ncbi:MAG: hypothetical protein MUD14_14315 [Hydrococcus sp. Prado102]|jgi:hypothetical protein|nr:hypothetical protein [Hydrococcus sp. Prado102]
MPALPAQTINQKGDRTMKRTILAGLSVLMLSALVSPAANATPQVEQISKQSIETSKVKSPQNSEL